MLAQSVWSSFIQSARPYRKIRPQQGLEQLENRVVLSAQPVYSAGILSITGSPDSDTIQISDNGQGVVSVQIGSESVRAFGGIEGIVVNTGDGDDTVRFTRTGGATSPIPQLDISTGAGHDDVTIGLLLPAVQKVRQTAAQIRVDLGSGDDRLKTDSLGVAVLDLDVTAGEGDDDVVFGMLLPAVQKVRESALRLDVDLGAGDDQLRATTIGVQSLDLDVTAGQGDDDVAFGMLLPAVQKVRDAAAQLHVDLGAGDDRLRAISVGIDKLEVNLEGIAGDDVAVGMLAPAAQKVRELAAKVRLNVGAVRLPAAAIDSTKLDFDASLAESHDQVFVGLLLPAVQKVRDIGR